MQIRKFEAFELSEALRAVKKTLGPDAVILSTREVKKKGGVFGLLSRPIVEVMAAADPASDPGEDPIKHTEDFDHLLEEASHTEEADGAHVREELRSIKESIVSLQGSMGMEQQPIDRLHEACTQMKGMLMALTVHARRQQHQQELSNAHQTLITLFDAMVSNGIDQETAMGLFKAIKDRLTPDDLWREDFARSYLKQLIKGLVQVSGPLQANAKTSKVVALVGPTGVGKTTTIAKLAAHQYHKKEKVTLATLDTYRVGAVEQLKTYAQIIGVPVDVAASGSELGERISRHKEGGLVLIDTAGRSHLNSQHVSELKELGKVGVPVETHLVLSLNTRESDLMEIIDRFSVIPIHRLLFTKIDETKTYGPLFSVTRRKKKSISYLTMGQRVPEDIEAATQKRVADLVLH